MDEHIIELAERAMAEQLQRSIDNRVQYQGVSLTECEGCGDDIPQARQDAVKGCRLCISCQQELDKRMTSVRRG